MWTATFCDHVHKATSSVMTPASHLRDAGTPVMFGLDPHTGVEKPASRDLLRLAIPRRVYTQSHMDYVLEAIGQVWDRRKDIVGLTIL